MKRLVWIAIGGVTLAALAGGVFFYLGAGHQHEAGPDAQASRQQHKTSATTDEERDASVRAQTLGLLEELNAVQDRVIAGDRGALAEQSRLMATIASVLRKFQQENWNDYANVRAAFVYVLSGGEPDVLNPLLNDDMLYAADRDLAEGIMSFARGDTQAARKSFDEIDPRSLDIRLTGPFALARASLYIGEDEKKAISLLDDARIAGPHTAIEEAAVRRQIPILMDVGDTPRATMLMADYVRRFGKSAYAWKLFQSFAVSIAKQADLEDQKMMEDLLSAISTADPKSKANLCLGIASEALLNGRIALAGLAADAVLKITPLLPDQLEKARLYRAAADAPSTRAEEALAILSQMSRNRLSENDNEIREVASFIARTVIESGKQRPTQMKQTKAGAEGTDTPRPPGALEQAESAMKEADKLISESM